MCGRRRWRPRHFLETLVAHPLLRHLVRGLVWGIFDADGARIECFRVAEDGTLADASDRDWKVPARADDDDWRIGIPHPLTLAASELVAWSEVWSDHALMQPFPQLARSVYRATDEERESFFLDRTDGWGEVPAFQLLGLEARGWRKGPPGDHGVIEWFEKPLAGTGWQFQLYFEGGAWLSAGGTWSGEVGLEEIDVQRVGTHPWTVQRRYQAQPSACLRFDEVPAEDFSELIRDVLTLRP